MSAGSQLQSEPLKISLASRLRQRCAQRAAARAGGVGGTLSKGGRWCRGHGKMVGRYQGWFLACDEWGVGSRDGYGGNACFLSCSVI